MILHMYQLEVQAVGEIFEKNFKQFKEVGLQVKD